MELEKLQSAIESLLFLSGEPLTITRLVQATRASEGEVEQALEALGQAYRSRRSGLVLVRHADEVQLTTCPENVSFVEELVKATLQTTLSKPALEVLSVIAYRGPISRAEIEMIRGVNCSMTLRNLLMRELIERQDNPNDSRGYLYTVSLQFLKELGLENISGLPDYEALRRDERLELMLDANNKDKKAETPDQESPQDTL